MSSSPDIREKVVEKAHILVSLWVSPCSSLVILHLTSLSKILLVWLSFHRVILEGRWCVRAVSMASSPGAKAVLMPSTLVSTPPSRGFVNGSMELYLAFMEGAPAVLPQHSPNRTWNGLETCQHEYCCYCLLFEKLGLLRISRRVQRCSSIAGRPFFKQ